MPNYHIVARGYSGINVGHVNPEVLPPSSPQEKKFLEEFVEERTASLKKDGGLFYDGDVWGVKLDEMTTNGSNLDLTLQAMKYSQHAGLFRNNHKAPFQALYVSALVLTSDNQILLGRTQATENQWMGKLNLPSGGVERSPDGMPTLGAQLYKELSEEIGFVPEHHLAAPIVSGWTIGTSVRENNYHLESSYIVPIRFSAEEYKEYFNDWKNAIEKLYQNSSSDHEISIPEFKDLVAVPADMHSLKKYVKNQDAWGKETNVIGRSLDTIDIWANVYRCDINVLQAEKINDGPRIFLPQPKIS